MNIKNYYYYEVPLNDQKCQFIYYLYIICLLLNIIFVHVKSCFGLVDTYAANLK